LEWSSVGFEESFPLLLTLDLTLLFGGMFDIILCGSPVGGNNG
jgi:hypothetical protein